MDSELDYFWGSISASPDSAPHARFSTQIHNPAIRYFHMILAHTFFGKPENDMTVSKEELFIMYCGSQGRTVNAAPFLLSNINKIISDPTRRICIGGFVTLLAKALALNSSLSRITAFGGIRPMNITYLFNHHMIGSLGPLEFQLLINYEPIHHFTLPNSDKTSVLDKENWIYHLEGQDDTETDPETPPLYHYTPAPASPPHPAASTTVPPPPPDFSAAIDSLQGQINTLRTDFHNFMDLVIEQLDRCGNQIQELKNLFAPAVKPSG